MCIRDRWWSALIHRPWSYPLDSAADRHLYQNPYYANTSFLHSFMMNDITLSWRLESRQQSMHRYRLFPPKRYQVPWWNESYCLLYTSVVSTGTSRPFFVPPKNRTSPPGLATVSYTHLDVYKRQHEYNRYEEGTSHNSAANLFLSFIKVFHNLHSSQNKSFSVFPNTRHMVIHKFILGL